MALGQRPAHSVDRTHIGHSPRHRLERGQVPAGFNGRTEKPAIAGERRNGRPQGRIARLGTRRIERRCLAGQLADLVHIITHPHHQPAEIVGTLTPLGAVFRRCHQLHNPAQIAHIRVAAGLRKQQVAVVPDILQVGLTVQPLRRAQSIGAQAIGDRRPQRIGLGPDFGPVIHCECGNHGWILCPAVQLSHGIPCTRFTAPYSAADRSGCGTCSLGVKP